MSSKKGKKAITPQIVLESKAGRQVKEEDPVKAGLLREEALRWVLSIIGGLLVYFIVAKITTAIYHPDVEALKVTATEMFYDAGMIRPEPVEALLFRLAIVVLIPAVIIFYKLLATLPAKILSDKRFYFGVSIACIVALVVLIYADFAANNPYGKASGERPQNKRDTLGVTNFDFYFDGIFIGKYVWAYTVIFVPCIALLFFVGMKKYNVDKKWLFKLLTSSAAYATFAFALIGIVLMNTINYPYTDENKFDFSAVYYSMTQVFAGSPMLVDGFTNTYGLYPHFLNPLFQLTGLSVLKFSMVLSILLGLSFILNFIFLKKLVRNQVILFLGFATVLFFPYLNFKLLTIFDCIFSLYPIRYIIPCIVSCLALWYFTRKTMRLYWITQVVAASLVLWNPEIGLVCYISWIVANVYNDFYDVNGKVDFKKIGIHILNGIWIAFVVFGAYKLLVLAFYGAWPQLGLLFSTMQFFGKYGVGLLPMVLIHPWNLSAIILLSGFLYAGSKWHHKAITPRATITLLVSLIGVGYFVYYQGRSQNSNFALSSGFTVILLTILADDLWEVVSRQRLLLQGALFVGALFILSFSFIEILYNAGNIVTLVHQEEDKKMRLAEENDFEREKEFIVNNTAEKEKILVVTVKKFQSLLFDGSKRVSAFNPGYIDLFLWSDWGRLHQRIVDSSFNIFMTRDRPMYQYMGGCVSAIAATYEVTKFSKILAMLSKSKTKIPLGSYFNGRANTLLHRKYNSDPAGIRRRIEDSKGMPPVTIDSVFSVEALFYSLPQALEYPTIIGNLRDSSGFAIGKKSKTLNKFVFAINATSINIDMPFNRWIYAVMNISPQYIEIYLEGKLMTRQRLLQRMRKSPNTIGVGNIGNCNNYIGPIAEVAVHNSSLDSNTVRNTWDNIKSTLPR